MEGSSSTWGPTDTKLAPGNFTVQWGPTETRNVSKQYVGVFTLKSGGKVGCLLSCALHLSLNMVCGGNAASKLLCVGLILENGIGQPPLGGTSQALCARCMEAMSTG